MKNVKIYSLILMLSILISCQQTEGQENQTSIVEEIEGRKIDSLLTPYVEELMELTDNNAGIAIGITNREKIIYAHNFGFANIEKGLKADFNSVFHIASVSKPFIAAAIVKLVENGDLDLDDSLIKHIPDFKMEGKGYEKITIKHILNHTSGIPRHVTVDDWLNPTYGPDALESNLSHVQNFELDFEPGSKFSYSNSAIDILGVVVSRVSGMPFHDYVEKEILKPAGMNNSQYMKPKNKLPEKWAASYSYGLKTEEWSPYPYTESCFPSSGLHTTVLDMCNWGLLHLNKGNLNGKEVLKEKTFELLTTPFYETPWGDDIGLSWFLQSYLDRPIIMHTGNDSGFEAMMYIYPEDGYSIIVMANRDNARSGRIINAASEILFDQEPKSYTRSAKYKFAKGYKENGIKYATELWQEMKADTTDKLYTNDGDILGIGAVLENRAKWKEAKEILEFYLTINEKSTYAWRLLGNAYLNLGDMLKAKSCYEETLKINPNYEKGKLALQKLEDK